MDRLCCKICKGLGASFTSGLSGMIQHTRTVHSNAELAGGRFICCIPMCSLGKSRLSDWIAHVECCFASACGDMPAGEDVYECCCGERMFTPEKLLKHTNGHLRAGQAVICPYNACIQRFSRYQTFYRHRVSVHAEQQPVPVRTVPPLQAGEEGEGGRNDSRDIEACSFSEVDEQPMDLDDIEIPRCDQMDVQPGWFVALNLDTTTRHVLLHLAMNSSYKVPKAKIRSAFRQIDAFFGEIAREGYPELFSEVLLAHNVGSGAAKTISEDLCRVISQNLPLAAFYERSDKAISSEYRITKFLKETMRYVDPVDLKHAMIMSVGYSPLSKGSGVYVDLTRNLTFFINNGQVSEILIDSFRLQQNRTESVGIRSYLDGTNCKKIRQNSPDGVYIDVALYADEAEPLNPLGKPHFLLNLLLDTIFVAVCC